jgi:hypothetical protein
MVTNVSEECTASIFKPEDHGDKTLRNFGNHLRN